MPIVTFTADDITAFGTLLLAVFTFITILVTVIMYWRDARNDALAQAYLVQVTGVATTVMINHGSYTIEKVEARLEVGRPDMAVFAAQKRIPGDHGPAAALGADVGLESTFRHDLLTPWDVGLRFSGPSPSGNLIGAYPVIRWRDRRGRKWQYCKGQARRIHWWTRWPGHGRRRAHATST